ncbi:hypothetical protein CWI75_11810 [Kineobactrum sediminis]|uniref:Uncharacterized protein n=1 Tax=Kineobactrum sediminis TaxID=1905677 RepID=A0A2N5Y220_9GAMM|nr:hypothetical protein [Kineobactrum sediminis]PLW82440.1 hypothetical protein CWI75_11810 [Kineobactrum sediminis]
MNAVVIWVTALLIYALFWSWYVGFRRKVTAEEVEALMALIATHGRLTEQQRENVRGFLLNDDGKDFVMVNLLLLKNPRRESAKKLARYQKIFLGALLRKAGHPVMVAMAASGSVENVACDQDEGWGAAGMIRYRSRRDLMEILPATIGSEHHDLKLESLERTFAFPASPWFLFGGPKVIAPLCIALLAALAHLAMVTMGSGLAL